MIFNFRRKKSGPDQAIPADPVGEAVGEPTAENIAETHRVDDRKTNETQRTAPSGAPMGETGREPAEDGRAGPGAEVTPVAGEFDQAARDEAKEARKKRGFFASLFGGRDESDANPASSPPSPPPQPPAPAPSESRSEAVAAPAPLSDPARRDPAYGPEMGPEIGPELGPEAGAETPAPAPPVPAPAPQRPGLFSRLASGLSKSTARLAEAFTKRRLDAETLEELEDELIAADLGAAVAGAVVERLAKDRFDKEVSDRDIRLALAQTVAETLEPREAALDLSGPSPQVIVLVGVNGSGKTTTAGKLAARMRAQGREVVLVAADTFRAAAIDQLKVWGERVGADVVAGEQGSDPAALAFDAIAHARKEGFDTVLIDTAGRLQNKKELMAELEKIVRVIRKQDPTAPHHVLLVLDATVGQNALSQAEAFTEAAGVTGLIMTKLDGTAKGGVLVALADAYELPIHYIGVGEKADDLQPFSALDFAQALAGLDVGEP